MKNKITTISAVRQPRLKQSIRWRCNAINDLLDALHCGDNLFAWQDTHLTHLRLVPGWECAAYTIHTGAEKSIQWRLRKGRALVFKGPPGALLQFLRSYWSYEAFRHVECLEQHLSEKAQA